MLYSGHFKSFCIAGAYNGSGGVIGNKVEGKRGMVRNLQ
jgi:hypothetical protein